MSTIDRDDLARAIEPHLLATVGALSAAEAAITYFEEHHVCEPVWVPWPEGVEKDLRLLPTWAWYRVEFDGSSARSFERERRDATGWPTGVDRVLLRPEDAARLVEQAKVDEDADLVERMAKAIWDAHGGTVEWESGNTELFRDDYRKAARAALAVTEQEER